MCTEKSIHPDAGRIYASDFASEHLIWLIPDRPAAWADPTTPTETGPFSAESSFRYTQGATPQDIAVHKGFRPSHGELGILSLGSQCNHAVEAGFQGRLQRSSRIFS